MKSIKKNIELADFRTNSFFLRLNFVCFSRHIGAKALNDTQKNFKTFYEEIFLVIKLKYKANI